MGKGEELKGIRRRFARAIGKTQLPLTEAGTIVGGGAALARSSGFLFWTWRHATGWIYGFGGQKSNESDYGSTEVVIQV